MGRVALCGARDDNELGFLEALRAASRGVLYLGTGLVALKLVSARTDIFSHRHGALHLPLKGLLELDTVGVKVLCRVAIVIGAAQIVDLLLSTGTFILELKDLPVGLALECGGDVGTAQS